jgi:hypothetical protein
VYTPCVSCHDIFEQRVLTDFAWEGGAELWAAVSYSGGLHIVIDFGIRPAVVQTQKRSWNMPLLPADH